jgi:hypothetical protein
MAAGEIDHLDLVEAELRQLADRVIDPASAQPFGVYVLRSDDPASELARHVERVVFLEAFGNTPELLAREYDPYEPSSTFLCVLDHRRKMPAGVMRLIVPSDAGLKSLDDLELVWGEKLDALLPRSGVTYGRQHVWDIATLAVGVDYRGRAASGLVSLALYQALCMSASQAGTEWFVSILDAAVLRMVQGQMRRPFSNFDGIAAQRYLDSKSSLPVWCDIATWSRRLAAADPTIYELLFEGHGLEAAVAVPDWARVSLVREGSPLSSTTRSVEASAPAG